mgnify:CR=1 FL=1
MTSNRCKNLVFDKTKKKYRKCKNKKCFFEYCIIHYNILYKKHILYIQSKFRGNKVRNKLNNIYCLLPIDIQKIIIKNMREYYYINKYNNTVCNIINNRLNDLIYSNYTVNIIYNRLTQPILTNYMNVDIFINNLYKIYLLMNKNNKIIIHNKKFNKQNILILIKLSFIIKYTYINNNINLDLINQIDCFKDIYNDFKYYNLCTVW